MKKRNIVYLVLLCILIFSLCGCGGKKKELEPIIKNGIEYIQNKYQRSFEYDEASYVLVSTTLFPSYSDDVCITFKDGTQVLYRAEENTYSDNYQSDQITEILRVRLWDPMLKKLEPYVFEKKRDSKAFFNLYEKENVRGSFFQTYFNGDISDFLEKEPLGVVFGYDAELYEESSGHESLYMIVKDFDEASQKIHIIQEYFQQYYKNGRNDFEFYMINPELYERYKKEEVSYMHLGRDGCFAEGQSDRFCMKNYIRVSDGIYITSAESGFLLEEGDITLQEAMDPEALQRMMDMANARDAEDNGAYRIISEMPVYELKFSERIRQRYSEDDSHITVYVKLVPDEMGISEDCQLYYYPVKDGIPTYNQSFASAAGNTKDGELEFIYTNQDKRIDYYWIGQQIRVEDSDLSDM